jgi:hypothetical protein
MEKNIYLETVQKLQPIDISTYTDVVIKAPAKVIWGYFTDERQGKFSPATYTLESGAWGAIDSVYSNSGLSIDGIQGHPFPKIRYKVIDSIPYKYHVLRMSMLHSSDAVETFIGYDVFILEESKDTTKLIFVQPLVFGNLNVAKEELPAFKEGQRKFIRPIFEDLKRLVESEYKR